MPDSGGGAHDVVPLDIVAASGLLGLFHQGGVKRLQHCDQARAIQFSGFDLFALKRVILRRDQSRIDCEEQPGDALVKSVKG